MAKYRLSKAAVKDLDAIWHYTVKQWSKQQASIYYREIASEIKNICKSGSDYGTKFFDVMEGLYFRRCQKHFIFYRYSDDGVVEIIRILHKMMDIESKF